MAVVANLAGSTPLDLKYSSPNRTAADLTAVLALTPTYPGEIALALDTGALYRGLALSAGRWGYIGPPADIVPGVLPQPSVTINQAAGQGDPTGTSPILFTVVFTQDVTGFITGDVTFTGTAGGTLVGAVSGGPATYSVSVTGMTTNGTVIADIAAGVATGPGGANLVSTSTDNTVTWDVDVVQPTVSITQGAGQADPTSTSPIVFDVVFSEVVTGFAVGDVSFTGTTAGGTLVGTPVGSGTTYTVEVTGMTTDGDVVVGVPAGVAQDAASNLNLVSPSTATVVWVQPEPPEGEAFSYYFLGF